VNFTLSDEQAELARTVRAAVGSGDPPTWQEMADLGWVGLGIPESLGGAGGGLVELAVVAEELGRVPLGGPYLAVGVLAGLAARHLGLADLAAGLASGRMGVTVALDESGHGDVLDRIRTRATRRGGRWQLSGVKPLVPCAEPGVADHVLVVARTEAGLGTFMVTDPPAVEVQTLDVTRRFARLELVDAPAEPVGCDGDQTAAWRRIVEDVAVVLSAELVGVMEASFDLALDYARQRVQFGRPIATFQVTKHKAADLLELIELSRVAVHYAAWASDAEDPVRSEAAAMAKSFVGRAANQVTAEGIQIHGAVGFTWECDAHRFYRRAKTDDLLLGSHGTWRHQVADGYLSTR
jgi:alkylation response protein AidB-like acyl-CoA dehydrogenase